MFFSNVLLFDVGHVKQALDISNHAASTDFFGYFILFLKSTHFHLDHGHFSTATF